jgi:hypothetical protein
MQKTEEEIQSVMNLLHEWECMKHLSVNDIDIIKYRLKLIAGCAVKEMGDKINVLVPILYEQVTKI